MIPENMESSMNVIKKSHIALCKLYGKACDFEKAVVRIYQDTERIV